MLNLVHCWVSSVPPQKTLSHKGFSNWPGAKSLASPELFAIWAFLSAPLLGIERDMEQLFFYFLPHL
jgi:hypothetical protein